jgi:hypothetical protein
VNEFNLTALGQFEQGYLNGVYLGDGYANYNKKNRHYSVEFFLNSARDQDIKEYLTKLLKKSGLCLSEIKDKRSNSLKIRVQSKQYFQYIQKTEEEFDKIELRNLEWQKGMLAGFIDAEGYVNKGEIVITQKNKEILDKMGQICHVSGVIIKKVWAFNNYKTTGDIWRMRISPKSRPLWLKSIKIKRHYGEAFGPP